jgi:hypothetical protein
MKQEREELRRELQSVEKQVEEGKVRENLLKTSNKVGSSFFYSHYILIISL